MKKTVGVLTALAFTIAAFASQPPGCWKNTSNGQCASDGEEINVPCGTGYVVGYVIGDTVGDGVIPVGTGEQGNDSIIDGGTCLVFFSWNCGGQFREDFGTIQGYRVDGESCLGI